MSETKKCTKCGEIKPIFIYETPEDAGFKECWKLSNIQPLTCLENGIKANKIMNLEEIEKRKAA
jgi:hypothetical protein